MRKLATRTITYNLRAHKLYRSGAHGHPACKLINWQCGWFLLQKPPSVPPSPRPQRRNQWHCARYAKHCTLISRSFLIFWFFLVSFKSTRLAARKLCGRVLVFQIGMHKYLTNNLRWLRSVSATRLKKNKKTRRTIYLQTGKKQKQTAVVR